MLLGNGLLLRLINFRLFCVFENGCTLLSTNIKRESMIKFIEAYKSVLPSSEVRSVRC